MVVPIIPSTLGTVPKTLEARLYELKIFLERVVTVHTFVFLVPSNIREKVLKIRGMWLSLNLKRQPPSR